MLFIIVDVVIRTPCLESRQESLELGGILVFLVESLFTTVSLSAWIATTVSCVVSYVVSLDLSRGNVSKVLGAFRTDVPFLVAKMTHTVVFDPFVPRDAELCRESTRVVFVPIR